MFLNLLCYCSWRNTHKECKYLSSNFDGLSSWVWKFELFPIKKSNFHLKTRGIFSSSFSWSNLNLTNCVKKKKKKCWYSGPKSIQTLKPNLNKNKSNKKYMNIICIYLIEQNRSEITLDGLIFLQYCNKSLINLVNCISYYLLNILNKYTVYMLKKKRIFVFLTAYSPLQKSKWKLQRRAHS